MSTIAIHGLDIWRRNVFRFVAGAAEQTALLCSGGRVRSGVGFLLSSADLPPSVVSAGLPSPADSGRGRSSDSGMKVRMIPPGDVKLIWCGGSETTAPTPRRSVKRAGRPTMRFVAIREAPRAAGRRSGSSAPAHEIFLCASTHEAAVGSAWLLWGRINCGCPKGAYERDSWLKRGDLRTPIRPRSLTSLSRKCTRGNDTSRMPATRMTGSTGSTIGWTAWHRANR